MTMMTPTHAQGPPRSIGLPYAVGVVFRTLRSVSVSTRCLALDSVLPLQLTCSDSSASAYCALALP